MHNEDTAIRFEPQEGDSFEMRREQQPCPTNP